MDISTFLELVHGVAVATVAVIILFEGVRRLRQKDFSRGAVVMMLIGSGYLLIQGYYAYRMNSLAHEISAPRPSYVEILNLADDWGANLPAAQRTRTSLEFAKASYLENGRLRYFFDPSGKRILHSPSQAEIVERESRVALQSKYEAAIELSDDSALRWLLIAVTAALTGMLFPLRKSNDIGSLS
jgi:hypothetical protein